MRLVIARCSVHYEGRLTAHLPTAVRLLMVKADGCVCVHADSGAYKPLNWMTAPNVLVEIPSPEEGLVSRWTVTNPKGERLTIDIDEVLHDVDEPLGTGPGLVKDGVEAHLQELLAGDPTVLEEGLVLIRREHGTDIGPVDLLCRGADGHTVVVEVQRRGDIDREPARPGTASPGTVGPPPWVAVEVKRHAGLDAVEQLSRYVACLQADPGFREGVRGLLAAQTITPQATTLARSRGITCVEVDYEILKGDRLPDLTLF